METQEKTIQELEQELLELKKQESERRKLIPFPIYFKKKEDYYYLESAKKMIHLYINEGSINIYKCVYEYQETLGYTYFINGEIEIIDASDFIEKLHFAKSLL